MNDTRGQGAANIMRAASKTHCSSSQSNGSLMRCTPIAVWAHRFSEEEIVEVTAAECTLTHCNPAIVDANTCYILAITHLIRHPKARVGRIAFCRAGRVRLILLLCL